MSPEDDVNKEIDEKDTDESAVEGAAVDNDADSVSTNSDETNSDKAKHSDDAENEVVAEQASSNDAESVAKNDAQADESDSSDKAAADGDDPLGFGTARMDGEEAGADGDSGEEAIGDAVRDETSKLTSQITEFEARVASQQDQLIRVQAEMENQRKRAQNDVTKAHKFALEKIALDLLPVKDSLEMGLLAATGEDAEPAKIIEGSELTLKMLAQVLEKYNIIEVNPVDEKFDPEFHQAMSMQPVEGKEPNTVASVMQKGYTLNDRLIRAALVMVAK